MHLNGYPEEWRSDQRARDPWSLCSRAPDYETKQQAKQPHVRAKRKAKKH
jgi:hypothetical protein